MSKKKGIGSFFKKVFGVADDAPTTVDPEKLKRIDDFTSGYDETTPPGEFKQGPEVIDQDGSTVVKEYSYNPESFTQMQMREGKGAFSEAALRQSYIDGKAADYMSFDEYVMQQRKISLEQLEAERVAGATKSKENAKEIIATESPPDEFFGTPDVAVSSASPAAKNFINRVVEASNRSDEEVRQAIVDIANEGYEVGSAKRMTIDDDAMIEAFLENKLMYNATDMEDFVDEFFEALSNVDSMPSPKISPQGKVLSQIEDDLAKEGSRVSGELSLVRSQARTIKSQLDEMGLDSSNIDFDILENSSDMSLVQREADKLKELMDSMLGGSMGEVTKSGNLKKTMESISKEVEADILRGKTLLDNVRSPGEGEEIIKKMKMIQKAGQEAMQTGVYKSPFDTTRTLNAEGGRIGFNDGGSAENATDQFQMKLAELLEVGVPLEEAEKQAMDFMKRAFKGLGGYAYGGRIGLKDGGDFKGGPKIGRRGFLGLLGAGAASLMLPFKTAEKVAPVVAKAIKPVAGMPDWFPLLVNRIRTKGKVKREPGYAEFTSGGDMEKVYVLDDYILYENMATGNVTVTGRGVDYQSVSMEYTPGENLVMTNKSGKKGTVTEPATFEAGEFAKGGYDMPDYENIGNFDDLKGDVSNWEKFATGGKRIDKQKSIIDDFIKNQTNPNVIDDMAKGGRVGMAQGGIASKFKERVYYGN